MKINIKGVPPPHFNWTCVYFQNELNNFLTFSQCDGRVRVSAGLGPAHRVDGRDLEAVDRVGLELGKFEASG